MNDDLEQYARLLEHQRHMENRALVLLGHFLTANAFALAAWASLYAFLVSKASIPMDVVLVSMAFFGYGWGLLWCGLGARNWGYARRLVAELVRLATDTPAVGQSRLFTALDRVERESFLHSSGTEEARRKWTSHPSVLRLVPLSVSFLYVALFALWAFQRELLLDKNQWFVPWIAIGLALAGLLASFTKSRDHEIHVETLVSQARSARK